MRRQEEWFYPHFFHSSCLAHNLGSERKSVTLGLGAFDAEINRIDSNVGGFVYVDRTLASSAGNVGSTPTLRTMLEQCEIPMTFCLLIHLWSYRLTAKTLACRARNRGSIPLRTAIFETKLCSS